MKQFFSSVSSKPNNVMKDNNKCLAHCSFTDNLHKQADVLLLLMITFPWTEYTIRSTQPNGRPIL